MNPKLQAIKDELEAYGEKEKLGAPLVKAIRDGEEVRKIWDDSGFLHYGIELTPEQIQFGENASIGVQSQRAIQEGSPLSIEYETSEDGLKLIAVIKYEVAAIPNER